RGVRILRGVRAGCGPLVGTGGAVRGGDGGGRALGPRARGVGPAGSARDEVQGAGLVGVLGVLDAVGAVQDHQQGGIGEVLDAVAAPLHDGHGAVEIGFEVEVVDLALAAE